MSFAKIFTAIYDGSLADHWQALVTFQQLLILCNENGIVDMTPLAIQRRTGIPLEIIEAGLVVLEQPDSASRSKAMDGRRIARLDADRPWGWFIVNHAEYRKRISTEEKRAADRARIADRRQAERERCREVSQPVASCSEASQGVAEVAQAEAEAEAEADKRTRALSPRARAGREADEREELADAIRKHGLQVWSESPELTAALHEGVTAEVLDELAELNPDKTAGYVIATARGQRSDWMKMRNLGDMS